MKTLRFIVLMLLVGITTMTYATEAKYEFRATWFTTHYAIDWPSTKATSDSKREQQKKEMTDIFDEMVAGNMNAVCMQVRSLCDATYKSSYEPWASILTGTRGKDPGYDPLAFAVEEAHKRGLELHLWVNPFRVTSSGTISTSDLIWQNAGQWIIKYDNGSFSGQIIDPGYPDARAYVIKVLMEIVNNYDVDGILMDDYFYPYGGTTTEDADSKALYKPADVVDVNQDGDTDDDWRRNNVDECMKMLYDTIQSVKPWVRFGMGPFGIWTTQKKAAKAYGISLPSGISGMDDYDVQACNTVEWVKGGYVDYINPQLYWATTSSGQDYDVLCEWWAKDVCEHFSDQLPDGKRVHFFSSQAAYRAVDDGGFSNGVTEIQWQITANRNNLSSGYTGSVFYNTKSYRQMASILAQSHFIEKALPPAMDWKVKQELDAPSNLSLVGTVLNWQHPTAERFTVYAYPKGLVSSVAIEDPQYLLQVVYGNSINLSNVGNLSEKTLAVCAYDRFGVEHGVALYNEGDAPILPPTQEADSITWVLNGGEVPTVEVPSNSELWDMLKPDYVAFYQDMYGSQFVASEDRTMDDVLGFTWINSLGQGLAADFMTQDAKWQWLTTYMLTVANAEGYEIITDNNWRYHLYSFFNCTNAAYRIDGYRASSTADFTTAGTPAYWGDAYQVAHGGVVLPSNVSETFVLPIPTHPEGLTFYGWYNNADFEGTPLVEIPAGWTGTLYACWTAPETVESIEWELNGGRVPADVPTNDSLWTAFKPYYNTYYNLERSLTHGVEKVATFAHEKMQEIMTDSESEYKWLGDYVLSVAESQDYSLSTDMSNANESAWRWHVHAFFNCNDGTVQGNQKVVTANFSQAGQPLLWGGAYQAVYDAVLPSHVSEEYELPIPVKEGNIFWGWYDNKSYQGTALTHIPADWTGKLYAKWYETTTDIAVNEAVEPIKVYDVFGRYVGNSTSHLSHGLYVIVQGNKTTKIIL